MHFARFVFAAVALTAAVAASAAGGAGRPIDYATGGIGVDEVERLSAGEKAFNLKLVFTLTEGNYVSDVSVVVKDGAGKIVLKALAPGPVFLARLPRAAYVVDATYEGRRLSRRIQIGDRFRTEYLRWPSNPETDTVLPPESSR